MKFSNKSTEPWDINFWERLKYLTQVNPRKKVVVYVYEKADTSTFRYRVYNMFQALQQSKSWNATYFFENELFELSEYLDRVDIIIFARTRWSLEIDRFMNLVKKKNISTAFDIDDLVFDIEKLPLIMSTLNVDFDHPDCYNYWFSYSSRLWLIGKMCDSTIGTNQFIGSKMVETFDNPNFVINNFLNIEQIRQSEKILKKNRKKARKFSLGYFSGTPSHINDFKTIGPEIAELLKKFPKLVLKVVGFMDFPDYLSQFVSNGQIVHSPLVDFLTLQEKIAEVDVNIVPLVNNEFTNCKSELKFFEAAIVETLTCAAPMSVFLDNIKSGYNGFICQEGEWYKTIEKLYKNGIEKDIVSRAKEYCLKKYSPDSQLPIIEETLERIHKINKKRR